MPGMEDELFTLCWCCQEPIPAPDTGHNRELVCLSSDSDMIMPVHRKCWLKMPEASRLELALKFRTMWLLDRSEPLPLSELRFDGPN